MPRTRYCDKVLDRHTDPKQRAKIVRAKLREVVKGRLTPAQDLLINTMVPLYLELDRMACVYSETGEMTHKYIRLQHGFRVAYEMLTGTGTARESKDTSHRTSKPPKPSHSGDCDLGDLFG